MSHTSIPPGEHAKAQSPDRQSALFTGMVMQQANLAMMCLGRSPRPDSGESRVDLEAASLFIDTLEMIEARTRGNLSADEAMLLRETLTSLRIAFVEAVDASTARPAANAASATAPVPPGTAEASGASGGAPAAPGASSGDSAEADARKKFVKRY
jgi:hypothetical protein